MQGRDLDPFEQRLTDALRSGQPGSDVDDLLDDVHAGARRRRMRRQGVGGAAAALVVVAAGAVIGQAGLLDHASTPPSSSSTAATQPAPPGPTQATATGLTPTAHNTRVLSLTSTGNDHQWALGSTTDPSCPHGACATLFARAVDGGWAPLDALPDTAAGVRATGPDVVSQVRFVGSAESGYDAYAFGPGLLSAHGITAGSGPSAGSWKPVDLPGSTVVDALEARGQTAYALVEDGENASELVSSPTEQDAFVVVDTGHRLQYSHDLNVSSGLVAFTSGSGPSAEVVSSPANIDTGEAIGPWRVSQPCAAGGVRRLSSAADTVWAMCADGSLMIATIDGRETPSWAEVPRQHADPKGPLAALNDTSALATTSDGLVEYDASGTSQTISAKDFGQASMLGFTNDQLGFAIDDGRLWKTTDGGQTWNVEDVTGTD